MAIKKDNQVDDNQNVPDTPANEASPLAEGETEEQRRDRLTVPEMPPPAEAVPIALRISSDPELFVYGTLESTKLVQEIAEQAANPQFLYDEDTWPVLPTVEHHHDVRANSLVIRVNGEEGYNGEWSPGLQKILDGYRDVYLVRAMAMMSHERYQDLIEEIKRDYGIKEEADHNGDD